MANSFNITGMGSNASLAGTNSKREWIDPSLSFQRPASIPATPVHDDLDREVYCLQGVPIDAISMQETVSLLLAAMKPHGPFLLSTPNLNFLINSQSDPEFRESLRVSDLCSADGVSLVWIARLLGVPLAERVAGADLFETLVTQEDSTNRLGVFLFGGADGVAAAAAEALNRSSAAVQCVGWLNPGFGSVDMMSSPQIIDEINKSGAQFLAVALGASKGQAWLQRNHHKIKIPVRSHLGATLGFHAGAIKRAPSIVRKAGFEWLWRIKEEPYLWKRYAKDASTLASLMLVRILPLVTVSSLERWRPKWLRRSFDIIETLTAYKAQISISGSVTADDLPILKSTFRRMISSSEHLKVDLSGLKYIDARALGFLMMARKKVIDRHGSFQLSAKSKRIRILFWLHGASDLLDSSSLHTDDAYASNFNLSQSARQL